MNKVTSGDCPFIGGRGHSEGSWDHKQCLEDCSIRDGSEFCHGILGYSHESRN